MAKKLNSNEGLIFQHRGKREHLYVINDARLLRSLNHGNNGWQNDLSSLCGDSCVVG